MAQFSKTPIGLVLLLWFSGLLAAGQFAKISVPFDQLRMLYPDQGAALGFVVSLISAVGLIFGLFAGLVIARSGFRTALLWALVGGALMSFVQASLPRFELFLFSRFLEGASHLAIVVAAPTMLAQIAAPRHRNFVMTLWSTFFAVSFALFAWVFLPLAQGKLAPLLWVHGGLMLALGAALWGALDRAIVPRAQDKLTLASVWRRHVEVYRSPYLAAAAFGWFFYAASFVALVTVLPDFMPQYERSFLGGVLPLSALVVSMTLGVALLARFPAMTVLSLGFGLCGLCLLSFALGGPALLSMAGMLGAMGLVQAGSFSMVPQLNEEASDRALANGAMAQMGNAGNLLGTPLVLLMIAGFGQTGMVLFGLIAFVAGISVHLWCALRRRVDQK